ncbi:MAG TPA: chemotaxis response regulator protein-glutamate methylesterase [Cyanobacteria bacterium UBA11149]|nr:chemotaxis response regulator protein-glutamate methylesterase [Cyanobacteria bacterium UBA11367]HBE56048.1 chemotaxis response regulator protein-glutamate methylesterase [Cyanobacteria bacterium UBA11366]HBK63551.1 chemotaxis response regulator protein-glutamate methylesterase [Cyanobacteria bacterium UBA11166]HBR73157.1 chemotaxis response regulator protein-glutamate methylesterase [Cyanobacteria bacterium UBA11159]HBS70247.1 chemotaxis response regulator protein-glutamate methylesterase [
MKIAIVNDMVMAVEALRRVLVTIPNYEVVWVARDGAEAVAKCARVTPDLILMDLIMPVMDGVEATRQIMKQSPCAILIVTASVGKNTAKVFEALGYGAMDAVNTPGFGSQDNSADVQTLLSKINTVGKLIGKSTSNSIKYSSQSYSSTSAQKIHSERPSLTTMPPLVVIGSSTGGPGILAAILSRLPANFSGAIAIIQHVDKQFAGGLVNWLGQQTPLTVKLAGEGDRLKPGTVLLAGTNDHLTLQSDLTLHYTKDPVDYPYRPSVDVFFNSLAQHSRRKGIAILLTGMGRDGAEGLRNLRLKGWHTIAQEQKSCAVYGMPKAAVELNAAVEILSPEAIAAVITKY